MLRISTAVLGICLVVAMLSGCGKADEGNRFSQADFDAMMFNWQKRNREQSEKSSEFTQARFDLMVADWLKRKEEQQRKDKAHGHKH